MVSFGKILKNWGTLGICFGCAWTVYTAEAQHFSAASYRNSQPMAENEMTVGEMIADQQTQRASSNAVQMPNHAVGNYAPEMLADDTIPTDWAAVSANIGQNVPQTAIRNTASASVPAASQIPAVSEVQDVSEIPAIPVRPVSTAGSIHQTSYDAPQTGSRVTNSAARLPRVQPETAPIRLTSHETAVQPQAVPVNSASTTKSVPSASPEPAQLPEDYPVGEMAPLDHDLIAFSETMNQAGGPVQQITLIDPHQKVLCVYHISMTTGQIELKSARKIEWDLQLVFLNSRKPLPQDVQAIIEQNRRRH